MGVGPQIFTSNTFGALTQALDAAAMRQEAIASNLANANTPGYHRKEVRFARELARRQGGVAVARTDPRHLQPSGARSQPPVVIADEGGAMRLDGNNVDPDAEAARLAETEITYAALTRALSAQFASLRLVVSGNAR